ncbi:uncharacterized protein JN550_013312 [Neoarthrinium moseri]|uniref:uncharacterized protein n=1 Tax=Neoarthrinium moseri TaxID=1658444 RepID=UPI001FDAE241|nr:uncharacterized protein JN550_013312 [Neoarthrinium moseri]KAI1857286.1 hypothetical protein JN550_013312 [Neoarthrinium moseri]
MQPAASSPKRRSMCMRWVLIFSLIGSSLQTALQKLSRDNETEPPVETVSHPVYPGIAAQYGNPAIIASGTTSTTVPTAATVVKETLALQMQQLRAAVRDTANRERLVKMGSVLRQCKGLHVSFSIYATNCERVTTTITSTITSTVSHFATVLASVEVNVDQTSTVVSTDVTTVSNVDIATDVIYTTTTVNQKRSLPSESARVDSPRNQLDAAGLKDAPEDDDDRPISPFAARFDPVPWEHLHGFEKKAIAARATSTRTTTVTVTRTTDVTSTISSTVTISATSLVLVTSVQSRTSVLNAKQTVSFTSTITEILRPPTVQTRTSIVTVQASETSSATSQTSSNLPGPTSSSDEPTTSTLPTSKIVGIAVGTGVGAILVVAALFVIWRLRRRRLRSRAEPWYAGVPSEGMSHTPQLPTDPSTPAVTPPSGIGQFTRLPRASYRNSVQNTVAGSHGRNHSTNSTQSYAGSAVMR